MQQNFKTVYNADPPPPFFPFFQTDYIIPKSSGQEWTWTSDICALCLGKQIIPGIVSRSLCFCHKFVFGFTRMK